jgi:hypothetical protein
MYLIVTGVFVIILSIIILITLVAVAFITGKNIFPNV